jgi:hypothetical protein
MRKAKKAMKTMVVTGIAALIGTTAGAGSSGGAPERRVMVCMEKGGDAVMVEKAQAIASRMFARISVHLEWHTPRTCRSNRDWIIEVSLSANTPKHMLPGALAYALPFEGTHINVFYDRINLAYPEAVRCLLALVLVHEITHILQGSDHHSDSGIMKARWNLEEYLLLETKPLAFTREDIDLIYIGLKARASRLAPGTPDVANSGEPAAMLQQIGTN